MRRPPLPTRLPHPPLRATAAFVCVLGVLGAMWLWLRDSSLVAVRSVTVTGVSGPDAGQVRAALADAARDMTTLHVKTGELRTAVDPYPTVLDVSTDADFPHGQSQYASFNATCWATLALMQQIDRPRPSAQQAAR